MPVFKRGRASSRILSSCTRSKKKVDDNCIRERAYFIWEEMGRPDGKDYEIWLQAEKELSCK